jgi:quinolinate synthase
MKKVSLNNVLSSLETLENPVELDEELRLKANLPLKRMLELAAK